MAEMKGFKSAETGNAVQQQIRTGIESLIVLKCPAIPYIFRTPEKSSCKCHISV